MEVEASPSPLVPVPEGCWTPESKGNPPRTEKAWTVGTLLDTIVLSGGSGGFSGVPSAEEAETLAAQAEQVADQLQKQIGSIGPIGSDGAEGSQGDI